MVFLKFPSILEDAVLCTLETLRQPWDNWKPQHTLTFFCFLTKSGSLFEIPVFNWLIFAGLFILSFSESLFPEWGLLKYYCYAILHWYVERIHFYLHTSFLMYTISIFSSAKLKHLLVCAYPLQHRWVFQCPHSVRHFHILFHHSRIVYVVLYNISHSESCTILSMQHKWFRGFCLRFLIAWCDAVACLSVTNFSYI